MERVKLSELAKHYPKMCIMVEAGDLLALAKELIAEAVEQAKAIKPDPNEDYLTRKEVAQMIGVTSQTLYRWAQRGYLKPIKIGGALRYAKSDCERMAFSQKQSIPYEQTHRE